MTIITAFGTVLEMNYNCHSRTIIWYFCIKIQMLRTGIAILLIMFIPGKITAQVDTLKHTNDTTQGRSYLLQQVERNGVTLPEIQIKEVTVVGKPGRAQRTWYRKYDRLVYNLKRVYPYALIVRTRLGQVNDTLKLMNSEKERRKYIKEVEKKVFGEYEDDMSEMTMTQGRLLIKLIDRETQNTSYELIRQYRGGLSAAFWQTIARIFGTNLKDEYDPYGEDVLIELILTDIEEGRI
jgi:hypothetical protein